MPDTDEESRTIFCGNLSDQVTEELLFELFLQVNVVKYDPYSGTFDKRMLLNYNTS